MMQRIARRVTALGIGALLAPLVVACVSPPASSPTPSAAATKPVAAATPAGAAPSPAATDKSATPKRGGALRVVAGEPTTLDPHLTQDAISSDFVVELFSGLVTINPSLQVVPDLAEKWEVSPDGKTYTFTLLQNAKFQDGKPLKAQDVKYSMERATDPRLRSPVAATYLGDIVGVPEKLAGQAAEVRGVRVVDDRTVEITTDAPKIYFIAKLTYPTAFVVDRQNVESGRNWTDRPNGSGPFRLKEFRRDLRLVLARNDNFYRTPPFLDEVVFDMRGGPITTRYENDEIDVHPGVSSVEIDRMLDRNGPFWNQLVKDATGNPGVFQMSVDYLGFNATMAPFDDPKVRQAFGHAIDKRLVIDTLSRGMTPVATGILPPGTPGYSADVKGLAFDPDLAKRLLAESRYAGGLPRIKLTVAGTGGNPGDQVRALVDQWKRNLGVDVEVEQVDWPTFLQDLKARRYQLFETGWVADYPDPHTFLHVLFHSKSGENSMQYANADLDRLLDQAATERDVQRRLSLYQQAEQMIVADAAAVPLSYGKIYPLVKPRVQGLQFSPIPVAHYQYVWLR